MNTAVVVGNPKPASRTLHLATAVVERITGAAPDVVVDLATHGAALLDRSDTGVAEALSQVRESDLVVVASPTYKGTYTGLLKLFLDRVGAGEWSGVTAVPVMLGGDLRHSLAPEAFLKPVLFELGAAVPTRSLFLKDGEYDDPTALEGWAQAAYPQLIRQLGVPEPA